MRKCECKSEMTKCQIWLHRTLTHPLFNHPNIKTKLSRLNVGDFNGNYFYFTIPSVALRCFAVHPVLMTIKSDVKMRDLKQATFRCSANLSCVAKQGGLKNGDFY